MPDSEKDRQHPLQQARRSFFFLYFVILLEVRHCCFEQCHVIVEEAQTRIAFATQDTSALAGVVVMIDAQAMQRTTDLTDFFHSFVLQQREAVLLIDVSLVVALSSLSLFPVLFLKATFEAPQFVFYKLKLPDGTATIKAFRIVELFSSQSILVSAIVYRIRFALFASPVVATFPTRVFTKVFFQDFYLIAVSAEAFHFCFPSRVLQFWHIYIYFLCIIV